MGQLVRRLFIEHPASVKETYLEHAVFATRFASRLFAAGFCALVHAFIPGLFEKTAGNIIIELAETMRNRGR